MSFSKAGFGVAFGFATRAVLRGLSAALGAAFALPAAAFVVLAGTALTLDLTSFVRDDAPVEGRFGFFGVSLRALSSVLGCGPVR